MLKCILFPFLLFITITSFGQKVNIEYLTYIGGTGEDMVNKITADKDGFIYLYGSTTTRNFLDERNISINTLGGCTGTVNAFIIKLTPNLDSIVFATVIGGNNFEIPYGGIVVDEEGIYIAGQTNSNNFPVTENALYKEYSGGYDAYLVKLNLEGNKIEYATYFGGSKDEQYPKLSLSRGKIILSMVTASHDYPITEKSLKDTLGGQDDLGICIFNKTTYKLEYSTYLGGSGAEKSRYALLKGGKLYITGSTTSYDYPMDMDAIKTEVYGQDMFLTVFDIPKKEIEYSTYLGVGKKSEGKSLYVDEESIIVCGSSMIDFDNQEHQDCQYFELSHNYTLLIDGDFGSDDYDIFNIAGKTDKGNLIFTGLTKSPKFPVSKKAIDKDFGGNKESVILIHDKKKNKIKYATFLGGDGTDFIQDYMIIGNSLVVAGGTASTDLKVTETNLQTGKKGFIDIMLARYKIED